MRVAVHPKNCTEELGAALAMAGVDPLPVDVLEGIPAEASGEWSILVVELGDEPMRRLRHIEAIATDTGLPVLVVAEQGHLPLLERAAGVADLVVAPFDALELGLRVRRLAVTSSGGDILTFGDLELNPLTYQATLGSVALDLTYMEYELLRYFVEHQGRVWTREQLLSKVWGYDYFGGARTVDVHVRRLRAKLGDERAAWITTVRSVGYRFG